MLAAIRGVIKKTISCSGYIESNNLKTMNNELTKMEEPTG
jgi:hypothetical protein